MLPLSILESFSNTWTATHELYWLCSKWILLGNAWSTFWYDLSAIDSWLIEHFNLLILLNSCVLTPIHMLEWHWPALITNSLWSCFLCDLPFKSFHLSSLHSSIKTNVALLRVHYLASSWRQDLSGLLYKTRSVGTHWAPTYRPPWNPALQALKP